MILDRSENNTMHLSRAVPLRRKAVLRKSANTCHSGPKNEKNQQARQKSVLLVDEDRARSFLDSGFGESSESDD